MSTNQIIDALKEQARQIVSSSLGTAQLEAFDVTGAGNFPYYWQDPNNLKFNAKTYGWIAAGLEPKQRPFELGSTFVDTYRRALSSVVYTLSKDDQAKLNAATSNAKNQQVVLLQAWQQAYGALPAGPTPLDGIVKTILTDWTAKGASVSLDDLRNATNLRRLLPNTPPVGEPILSPLALWLNAVGGAVGLQNATTMNAAYVARALDATQSPTSDNGGLPLNTGKLVPAYSIATALPDILNQLANDNQVITLEMTVTRSTEDQFDVSVSGGAKFSIPVLDFLSLNVGGNASYFKSTLATTGTSTVVKMTFPGVTLVNFAPAAFVANTGNNWYWVDPIVEALSNGNRDVSGYKFSPAPGIDFTSQGPFGFLQGVVVSRFPTIQITTTTSDYKNVQSTFQQSVSLGISFLGIPLGFNGSESTYSHSAQIDASSSTVSITLAPPKQLVGVAETDALAWVLGVLPKYPASL